MRALNKKSLILIAFLWVLCFPEVTLAGLTYQPLVGIPGVDNASSNFNQYINQLYFVSISIAALLAVIKIIIGGVKWMLTDVVTQKSDAKDDIRSALLGLLLIIAAVLILGTINPQLTNLNVLQDAPGVRLERPSSEQFGPPAPTPADLAIARRDARIESTGAIRQENALPSGDNQNNAPGEIVAARWVNDSCTQQRPCLVDPATVNADQRRAWEDLVRDRRNLCFQGETVVFSGYYQTCRGIVGCAAVPGRFQCYRP